MLKVKSLAWCGALQHRLREEVERAEVGMDVAGKMGSLFGDPGQCNSGSALRNRTDWAHTLVELHELDEDLGTLDDEWWNGPKIKKPKEKDFHGLFRDDEIVQRQLREAMEQWETEQHNEHWNRRKEAEAQRVNPNRKFKITHD